MAWKRGGFPGQIVHPLQLHALAVLPTWLKCPPTRQFVPKHFFAQHRSRFTNAFFASMDIIQLLRSFDPHGMSSDQLRQAVDCLAIAGLKAKAAAQLQPAFVAESAEFQGFSRLSLQRLESTLQDVFLTPDSLSTEKIEALRELDVTSFIVCGLCLSKKTLVRLDRALFEEIVRQARGSSHRLVNIIIASSEVAEVVRKSGSETFTQSRHITAAYLLSVSDKK